MVYTDSNKNGVIHIDQGEITEENHYYAFGMKQKTDNDLAGNGYKYKFGGKEWDSSLGLDLYDFGARNYDPTIGRWMNVDPLAEKSRRWSPYNYAYNNPILYVDPDGREVIIFYKVGDENKTMNYSYVKDRKFEDDTPDFVKNTLMSLDQLHSNGAMNITFGEGDNAKNVDVLGQFVGSKDYNITMTEGIDGNSYTSKTNTISFISNKGIEFKKDLDKEWTEDNTGRNSASAVLGHEIIHGYNHQFDNTNYTARKADKLDKTVAPYFPNKEEQLVTTNLTNQVNTKLGQDKRTHYSIRRYFTKSSTSTEKKE